MKKRIGIMTLYYKNNNYGGVAQAYALNEYLMKLGYESQLICYNKKKSELNLVDKNKNFSIFIKRVKNKILRILKKPLENILSNKFKEKLLKREVLLENFRDSIAHSKVYDKFTIKNIENEYDCFITGSDQSWNPGVIDEAFVFSFLNEENEKNIFSYAASVAVTDVTDRYIDFMKKELKKYNKISVREEQSVDILSKTTNKNIEWVVDPTLLLDRDDWEKITNKRIIKEKYIFSYMLGNSRKQRKKIKKFAKEKNLILVTIPYIKNGNKFEFKLEDYKFGDIQMIDISFNDFLSLIKYSEYVITDSFHAMCFSYIFEKEFYIFEKDTIFSTNNRISSLLNLFEINNRIIKNYIPVNDEKIDYKIVDKNIGNKIRESKKFLDEALK